MSCCLDFFAVALSMHGSIKSSQILVGAAVWIPLIFLCSCFTNNPYPPAESGKNILYTTFTEEPKHLDPARSYSENEYKFICQIYEPVVQYNYLKRPYTVEALTAETMPVGKLYDKDGVELKDDAPAESVAKVVYEIKLKPGIRYQDHPCFAMAADGKYRWHLGMGESLPKVENPLDIKEKATRELTAEDYVYQIKRLGNPVLECPIAGAVLGGYVQGFDEFQKKVAAEYARVREERRKSGGIFYNQEADERLNPIYLDLRKFDLPGVQVVDKLTFRITLTKKYPQFIYWLAMPFFAPIPWEADRFYTQPAAAEQNITLDRFPVGTGPFYLSVNVPNFRMVLTKNANFRGEPYPSEGEAGDQAAGLLADAGKSMPFMDQAVFTLEKESVPSWNKFNQGYYDASSITSDMFDQAVQMSTQGAVGLTDDMKQKNIKLRTSVATSTYYYAFNMLDDVVGGYDEKKCKLRQALSIAVDLEEYIQIFANGRGIAGQSPIPPGIFGYQEGKDGINPYVYDWDDKAGAPRRKSLETAKQLLAEAGYPNGRDSKGNALVISYDVTGDGADSQSQFDWMIKQFANIGVQLQIHATDYNRFQDKALKGNFQLIGWGWNADYPDPENFLFLLYGPNSKVKSQQENAANYENPKFDALFKKVENMSNTPERAEAIKQMLVIARHDAPWIWGFHPVDYALYHEWFHNVKPTSFGENSMKYKSVDPALRLERRREWNQPVTWPLWTLLGLLIAGSIPAAIVVYRRERT